MLLNVTVMNLRKKQYCLELSYITVSCVRTAGGVVFKEPFDFEHFKHKESAILQDLLEIGSPGWGEKNTWHLCRLHLYSDHFHRLEKLNSILPIIAIPPIVTIINYMRYPMRHLLRCNLPVNC
jgi:hypothetical protein